LNFGEITFGVGSIEKCLQVLQRQSPAVDELNPLKKEAQDELDYMQDLLRQHEERQQVEIKSNRIRQSAIFRFDRVVFGCARDSFSAVLFEQILFLGGYAVTSRRRGARGHHAGRDSTCTDEYFTPLPVVPKASRLMF
jgi:hypothetical protein